MQCLICHKEIPDKGFGHHLKIHGISKESYFKKYVNSSKNIDICQNENCNNKTKFLSFKKGFQRFCSSKCSNSSKEVKVKNSNSHIGKKRPDMLGLLNPSKKKEIRSKISNKLKGNKNTLGRKFTKEEKENISKRVTQYWIDNPDQKLNIKSPTNNFNYGYFYSSKCNKELFYRSSYELRALQKLESDENVISYNYEPFLIEYIHENKIKHYKPDFLVKYKDEEIIIEVKPLKFINTEINILKKQASEKFFKFKFWTEKDLLI